MMGEERRQKTGDRRQNKENRTLKTGGKNCF
jgi:hypothetical protein